MRHLVWSTTHGDTVEVYEADDGPRYRVKARNGETVEQSSEAYASFAAAVEAAERHHPVLAEGGASS